MFIIFFSCSLKFCKTNNSFISKTKASQNCTTFMNFLFGLIKTWRTLKSYFILQYNSALKDFGIGKYCQN